MASTTIKISDELYFALLSQSEAEKVTVEAILERWVRLGQLVESQLTEEEIKLILNVQAKMKVTIETKKSSF